MGFTFKQNTAFQPISKHLKEEEEELHISDLLQFQLSPASACEFPFQLAREKQAQLRELRQIQSESEKKKLPLCLISAGNSIKKPMLERVIFRIDCSLTSSTSVTLSFGSPAYQRRGMMSALIPFHHNKE